MEKVLKQKKNITGYFIKFILPVIICAILSGLFVLGLTEWSKKRAGKELVEKIHREILKSLEDIKADYNKQDSMFIASNNLIKYAERRQYDSVTIPMIRYAMSFYDIKPVYVSYGALDMQLIKNTELKKKLVDYENQIKFGFEDRDYSIGIALKMVDLVDEFFGEYFIFDTENDSFSTLGNENYYNDLKKLLTSKKFIGLLKIKTRLEKNRCNYQKEIKQSMYDIERLSRE